MRFTSPGEDLIYLAVTSGHTFTVGSQPVEVPPMFYAQALAKGCVPYEMGAQPMPDPQAPESSQIDLICDAIVSMLVEEDKTDLFLGDGRPNVMALNKRLGFTASAEQRDEAWGLVQKSMAR